MYLVFISIELTATRPATQLVGINILQYAVLCVPYSYFIEDSTMCKLDLWTLLYCFRNFVFHVMEFHRSEERFVSSFVKASRDHYGYLLFPKNTAVLSSKYIDASVTRTVHGLVEEVNNFSIYHIVCISNMHFVRC